MGFMDFLSPALTVGTQAAGAYEQAKGAANQRNTQNFLQSAMLLKQQHDDQIEQGLRGAQTDEARARTNMILNPAETWGDAEDIQGPDGKLQRVLRSNRGNIRPIGAPPPKIVRRQDVTLDMGGQPAKGSYDPEEDAYYVNGQKVDKPKAFVSPDPMARFFEGQRQENDQRQAAEWQRHYDRLVTPKLTKYGTVEPGTGLPPAEAAAQADEIYGSHPRLAPKIQPPATPAQPPMGGAYRTP